MNNPEFPRIMDPFWEPPRTWPTDLDDDLHPEPTVFAKDFMTADVITVVPDTPVAEVAKLLIERRISAVPVVEEDGAMVGLVSEGDLVHRIDGDYRTRRPWWLMLFGDPEDDPHEYLRAHGSRASDIMTREVITVTEYTDLAEVVKTLESNRIKRAPVVRDGKLVGIVSRRDVIQYLATSKGTGFKPPTADDREIRERLLEEVRGHPWAEAATVNVVVVDGVVRFFGFVDSKDAREALRVAAENIPGVVSVEDNLGINSLMLVNL